MVGLNYCNWTCHPRQSKHATNILSYVKCIGTVKTAVFENSPKMVPMRCLHPVKVSVFTGHVLLNQKDVSSYFLKGQIPDHTNPIAWKTAQVSLILQAVEVP